MSKRNKFLLSFTSIFGVRLNFSQIYSLDTFYDIYNYNSECSLGQEANSYHVSGQILEPATQQPSWALGKGSRLYFSLILGPDVLCCSGESAAGGNGVLRGTRWHGALLVALV